MRKGKTLSEGLQTGHNNDRGLGKGANGSSGPVALEGHPDDLAVPAKRVSTKEQRRKSTCGQRAWRAERGADGPTVQTSRAQTQAASARAETAAAQAPRAPPSERKGKSCRRGMLTPIRGSRILGAHTFFIGSSTPSTLRQWVA